MEHAESAELKRFARQLEGSDSEETRAAARAILLLADEVESLTLALTAERGGDGDGTGTAAANGYPVSWSRRTLSTDSLRESGSS